MQQPSLSWSSMLSIACGFAGWMLILSLKYQLMSEDIVTNARSIEAFLLAAGTVLGVLGVRRGDGIWGIIGFLASITIGAPLFMGHQGQHFFR